MKKKILVLSMAAAIATAGITGCTKGGKIDEAVSSTTEEISELAKSMTGKNVEASDNPFAKKSLEEVEKLAEEGDINARLELGDRYYFNFGGVAAMDYKKAFDNYKIAADTGDAYGQYSVAYCYETAAGTEENFEEAMKYYKLAAEQKEVDAIYSIGYLHQIGRAHV